MNKAFIKSVLKTITGDNNPMDKWLTLAGCCQRISMLSDNNLGIDPIHRMYYFCEDDEMLYIRNLDGNLIPSVNNVEGYVSMTLNGVTYLNKISESSIDHETAGVFHSCVSFDKIVAFYYPDVTGDVLEGYLNDIREGV